MAKNPYRQSVFLTSAAKISQIPEDSGREVAFVGRSNVGKSSVINCLTENKGLAKTSKTPGRTRLMNFFTVENGVMLVDLPGYGFARVDKSLKDQWRQNINEYFTTRKSLCGVVLIVDIRRELRDEELLMLDWCDSSGVPLHMIVNKADKLPYSHQKTALLSIKTSLKDFNATSQLFSVTKKIGVEEAISRLNTWHYD